MRQPTGLRDRRHEEHGLAAVSHELRSLTSILGLALTLERQVSDDDREDLLARLAANARKLDRLLKDLLDIDRLSRSLRHPQYRLTDIGSLVRRTIENMEAVAGRHLFVQTEPVLIPVDPAKVERIVENLVANAARHTAEETPVQGSRRPKDGGALSWSRTMATASPRRFGRASSSRSSRAGRLARQSGNGDRALARRPLRGAARQAGVGG